MSPRTLASLSASASTSSAAARRARSYLARLPLFTRAVLAAVALFWAAGLQSWWNVRAWGALVPREIGFATCKWAFFFFFMCFYFLTPRFSFFFSKTGFLSLLGCPLIPPLPLFHPCANPNCMPVYRINTFPLIHLNTLHALMNAVALTPLLERFEHEHGTLTSVALFFGRESLPTPQG